MDVGYLPLIGAAALLTLGTRLGGLGLGDRAVPDALQRFLGYVPIAAFAALVTPGLGGGGNDQVPRLLAAGAAAVVVLRFRRLWACLATGMAVFWLTRWIV
jgi:branched-subunit amino acid transport protein